VVFTAVVVYISQSFLTVRTTLRPSFLLRKGTNNWG